MIDKQIEKRKITQWIAIDKELIGTELNMSLPESEEDIDPEALMSTFGVH
jgi:hypothetical protein